MKILYLHQYFNSPDMPGSTRSYEFAKALSKKGNTVSVVTSDWQNLRKKKQYNIDGINVYSAPIYYSNKMNFFSKVFSFFSYACYAIKISRNINYDIVFASSTPLTIGIPALYLKKRNRAKLIFEVRDMWPQLPIAFGVLKSRILIYFAESLERKIYSESDAIIALSKGMKKEIIKIINSEEKITVITNLSDIKRFRINNSLGKHFRNEILKIFDEPLIVYAGALGRINNVLYLVEIAYESFRSGYKNKFLIVGDGYQKKIILNKSKNMGILNKNLFLLDTFPKNKLPNILSAATLTSSLFVDLPEMENNSANKFFDGLAAGKPIMINYKGWQADLLRKSGAGFIIPSNDPTKANILINDIVNDKKRINKMALQSKQISKKFSVDLNCEKFKKIIDNVYNS